MKKSIAGILRVARIPHKCKSNIRKSLERYGVNHLTLFPDLDGLGGKLERYRITGSNSCDSQLTPLHRQLRLTTPYTGPQEEEEE